jgi:HrpA-like RNA helicase
MSATLDIGLFAAYFRNAFAGLPGAFDVRGGDGRVEVPTLEVQGKVFPVQTLFLEDVLGNVDLSRCPPPRRKQLQMNEVRGKQALGAAGANDMDPVLSAKLLEQAARRRPAARRNLTGPHCENEDVSPATICAVIAWLCSTDPLRHSRPSGGGRAEEEQDLSAGAVLVFMPGSGEINAVRDELLDPGAPWAAALQGKAVVLPLHGSLPLEQQQRVFERPPAGMRKVVLSTNVAESSVTIDDVAYVVNSGKVKEKRYDGKSGVESLLSTWASLANNKQRKGRGGRVREGMCIHMFVKERNDLLRPFQLPEMRRVPLEQLCLNILHLNIGNHPALSYASPSSNF